MLIKQIISYLAKYLRHVRHYWHTPCMAKQTLPSTSDGIRDMYYKDTICLNFDADKVDNEDWVIENNTLRLKNPEKLDRCFYSLTLFYNGTELVHGKYKMPVQTKHYINVRVRSWINDEYALHKCSKSWLAPQYVKEFDDFALMISNNILYRTDLKGKHKHRICKIYVSYDEGLEIARIDDYYALRSGTKILFNKGLSGEWKVIFDNKISTGIKNSMIWVKNELNEPELLFSEYTIEWGRHHIYCYNVVHDTLTKRQTFYSIEEHNTHGLEPFARHTHLMVQDPYTGYIFIGNGDYSDGSSAIYYSKDNCHTLIRLGTYSQCYRTLSFFFTEKSVFWNMDSPYEPQYICRLRKVDMPESDVEKSPIVKFPLIHSAHWLIEMLQTKSGEIMYVMSSNHESNFYDDRIRTYGIKIINEEPVFYELLALPYNGDKYHQYYPMGVLNNKILLMDTVSHKRAFYRLK